MAPAQPKPKPKPARPSLRTRASKTSSTRPSYPPPTATFASTKKDKRTIKHSALLSRIEKAAPTLRPRRHPTKSPIPTLTSLADALPAIEEGSTGTGVNGSGKKSLRTRPGAMKRLQNLETMERERFARNMAQMAGPAANQAPEEGATGEARMESTAAVAHTGTAGTAERWAALRGFIQQTLETRPGTKVA